MGIIGPIRPICLMGPMHPIGIIGPMGPMRHIGPIGLIGPISPIYPLVGQSFFSTKLTQQSLTVPGPRSARGRTLATPNPPSGGGA